MNEHKTIYEWSNIKSITFPDILRQFEDQNALEC